MIVDISSTIVPPQRPEILESLGQALAWNGGGRPRIAHLDARFRAMGAFGDSRPRYFISQSATRSVLRHQHRG